MSEPSSVQADRHLASAEDAASASVAPSKASVASGASGARLAALLALAATSAIWGFAPVAIRSLVVRLPALDLLVLRYAICIVAYVVLLTALRGWRVQPADLPRFLAAAATGTLGYNVVNNLGAVTTPASLTGLILGIEPVLIAVLAALVLGERPSRQAILGLALAAAGTVVLFSGDLLAHGVATATLGGPLLVLASAVLWSLSVIIVRPLLARYGALRASALTGAMGAVPILAMGSPATLDLALAMSATDWAVLLFLAILGTLISLMLWNYGNKHVSAASAAAFIYSVPLMSVIGGVVLLGETLTLAMLSGGAMIFAGVCLAQWRRSA